MPQPEIEDSLPKPVGDEVGEYPEFGAAHGGFDELISDSRNKLYHLINKVLQEVQVQHEMELKAARRGEGGRMSIKPRATVGREGIVREGTVDEFADSPAPERADSSRFLQLADLWVTTKRASRRARQTQDRSRHVAEQYDNDIFQHTTYRGIAGKSGKVSGYRQLVANPSSSFNTTWRLVAIFLLCFDCLTVPMTVFDLPEDSWPMRAMLYIMLVFWTLDMPLSCLRGFINQAGDLEIRPKRVIMKYLRTQFLQDLALLIIEWVNFFHVVLSPDTAGFRQGSVVRVLKFMRLLKITKASILLSFLYRWMGSDLLLQISVPKVAIAILLLQHLMACGWHWISGEPGEFQERYAVALHWTFSQMGFCWTNDEPTTFGERIYAICVGTICMTLLTVLIGAIVSEMARTQAKLKTQRDEEARMRVFLRFHRISFSLRNRIWTFLHKSGQQKKYISQRSVELARNLPGAIHLELEAAVYVPVLTHHPFFGTYAVSGVSSHAMRRLFEEHAVEERSVVVEHELFEAWTPSKHMYFLANGQIYYRATRGAKISGRNSARGSLNLKFSNDTGVDTTKPAKESISKRIMRFTTRAPKKRTTFAASLSQTLASGMGNSRVVEVPPGGWLCEAALWLQWRHVGIAAAKNDCELVTVEAEKFRLVMQQELPEAQEYAKLFVRYAREFETVFDDFFFNFGRLQNMAKEVFEPPLFFNIAACQPAVDGCRNEWLPTNRKQWNVIWASPWKDGHKHNTSALISTLTQDMKNDAVLLYQTMFAQNLYAALKVHLSPEETQLHDQRVNFLKRLILCLAVCRLRFTSEENGRTTRMWPYPLASALCHGSRILVHLSDVSWKSFLNLMLFGEESGWSWDDGRAPAPIYNRRAASHGIRFDQSSSRFQETKLNGVAALSSNHLGMDLPLGGLGNPTPQGTHHGQLFVGPAGVPFKKAWMQNAGSAYLTDVQHGHMYMRWDEIGDTTDMKLAMRQDPPSPTNSMRRQQTAIIKTRSGNGSGSARESFGDYTRGEAYVWSSQMECWLPPEVFGGESWNEVPPTEDLRNVLGDQHEDVDLTRLHKLWATDKEMSLEWHADGRLRCRVLLVRLSISFRDGGSEKFLVQTHATAEYCRSESADKASPGWDVDVACQPTVICPRHQAWKTAVERYFQQVFGLSGPAMKCIFAACRLGEDPYIRSSEPAPSVCHHHAGCGPSGVDAVYDLLHLDACLRSEDRPLFEPLLAPGLVTKEDADIQGFGGCNIALEGTIVRKWQWLSRKTAEERGLNLARPEDSCRLVLAQETKNANTILLGIESSAPLKKDLFGHKHGVDAVSKSVSAFGKRKWRDYRSGGQEVPADMGGMHVHVDAAKFKQLVEAIQSFSLCKPSDGSDPFTQDNELTLFRQLLQSSDLVAGDILEDHLDLDRDLDQPQEEGKPELEEF